MGNHEYCDECGESDFHHGQPCNPVKKAKKDKEKRLAEVRVENRIKKIRSDLPAFVNMGYNVNEWDIDYEHGRITLWPN